MVTGLSARLMKGHNFSSSVYPMTSNRNNYGTKTFYTDNINSNLRSSIVVTPPGSTSGHDDPTMTIKACSEKLHHISGRSHGKSKSRGRSNGEKDDEKLYSCFKRRKIDELQYAAHCVKKNLKRGGLPFPSLDTSLRHHLDLDRHAGLVGSKSVSSSPFLANISSNHEMEGASMVELNDLFLATFDSYSKPQNNGNSNVAGSDWSSTCSLASDSELAPSIAPLLEHGLVNKSSSCDKLSEARYGNDTASARKYDDAIYANPISIREVFENSEEARLVTLSFAPFLVVHVNPAYTSMTGLTPADILGKPFHEAIQELDCKSTTAKATSLATLHERITTFSSKKKTSSSTDDDTPKKCRIRVSVVGTEPAAAGNPTKQHDTSYMTHYMISLGEEEDAKTDSEEETTASATAASTSTADRWDRNHRQFSL